MSAFVTTYAIVWLVLSAYATRLANVQRRLRRTIGDR
jgi:hypothetical protein